MKDPDLRDMCRVDLEDEVMLLRAQVKVLMNWKTLQELRKSSDEAMRASQGDDYTAARLRAHREATWDDDGGRPLNPDLEGAATGGLSGCGYSFVSTTLRDMHHKSPMDRQLDILTTTETKNKS